MMFYDSMLYAVLAARYVEIFSASNASFGLRGGQFYFVVFWTFFSHSPPPGLFQISRILSIISHPLTTPW